MTEKEFINLIEKFNNELMDLYKSKAHDYADKSEFDANFKEVGRATGDGKYKAWLTYFTKHRMSIENFIKKGKLENEPIESRISDCIVYLWLLLGMVEDEKQND